MRTPSLVWVTLAVGLALAPPVAAQPAPAPAKAEALQRFNRGVELSREGDARAALVEFRRAYELLPNYRVLYNIGQVSYELQDYVTALRSFEEYLAGGGAEISKKRRAEVDRELEKLRPRVATAAVSASVEGAEVSVDDVPVGRAPLAEPLRLNPGKHRVTAVAPGKQGAAQTIDVAGGDRVQVDLRLDDEARPAPAAPLALVATRAPVPWLAWGLTGALALGTGVTGFLALRASSRLDEQKGSLPVRRDDLDSTRGQMRGLALATDILGGATLVTGAIATYLTLRRPAGPVAVGVSPGAVSVGGAF
ncbi:MAG: PEGA domain-containing protein [Myxococcales bacterium]|nr:MAG: PEGA domain-containing protein [Myxococcales bacterium]